MGKESVGVAVGVLCEGCGLGNPDDIDLVLRGLCRWERETENGKKRF